MTEKIINIFLNQYVSTLIILTISGYFLRTALVICGQRWANTYHHLATYMLLPGIGFLITSVIKNDIALSLGMIGALSIVRFRNPVKSPFELVIFFGLLTMGILSSVEVKLSLLLLVLLLSVIFGIKIVDRIASKFGKSLFQHSFGEGTNPFTLEVISSEIIESFQKEKSMVYFFSDKKNKNITYRFIFKSKEDLMELQNSIEKDERIINIRAEMQS